MEHLYVAEAWMLEGLMDLAPSPEEFLISLEDALESGELTIDEVRTLLSDYNARNRHA